MLAWCPEGYFIDKLLLRCNLGVVLISSGSYANVQALYIRTRKLIIGSFETDGTVSMLFGISCQSIGCTTCKAGKDCFAGFNFFNFRSIRIFVAKLIKIPKQFICVESILN